MSITARPLNRRKFLRGSGAAIALPMLEATHPVWGAPDKKPPMRLVCVGNPLRMLPETFFSNPRPANVDPPKVDASGMLGRSEAFSDIVSFKDVLLRGHRDQFAPPADGPEVDRIVAQLKQRGSGLRDLVVLVVSSETFQHK